MHLQSEGTQGGRLREFSELWCDIGELQCAGCVCVYLHGECIRLVQNYRNMHVCNDDHNTLAIDIVTTGSILIFQCEREREREREQSASVEVCLGPNVEPGLETGAATNDCRCNTSMPHAILMLVTKLQHYTHLG